MNHQKNFVDMMAALIGKQIRPEDAIALSKAELKQSCATLSDKYNVAEADRFLRAERYSRR